MYGVKTVEKIYGTYINFNDTVIAVNDLNVDTDALVLAKKVFAVRRQEALRQLREDTNLKEPHLSREYKKLLRDMHWNFAFFLEERVSKEAVTSTEESRLRIALLTSIYRHYTKCSKLYKNTNTEARCTAVAANAAVSLADAILLHVESFLLENDDVDTLSEDQATEIGRAKKYYQTALKNYLQAEQLDSEPGELSNALLHIRVCLLEVHQHFLVDALSRGNIETVRTEFNTFIEFRNIYAGLELNLDIIKLVLANAKLLNNAFDDEHRQADKIVAEYTKRLQEHPAYVPEQAVTGELSEEDKCEVPTPSTPTVLTTPPSSLVPSSTHVETTELIVDGAEAEDPNTRLPFRKRKYPGSGSAGSPGNESPTEPEKIVSTTTAPELAAASAAPLPREPVPLPIVPAPRIHAEPERIHPPKRHRETGNKPPKGPQREYPEVLEHDDAAYRPLHSSRGRGRLHTRQDGYRHPAQGPRHPNATHYAQAWNSVPVSHPTQRPGYTSFETQHYDFPGTPILTRVPIPIQPRPSTTYGHLAAGPLPPATSFPGLRTILGSSVGAPVQRPFAHAAAPTSATGGSYLGQYPPYPQAPSTPSPYQGYGYPATSGVAYSGQATPYSQASVVSGYPQQPYSAAPRTAADGNYQRQIFPFPSLLMDAGHPQRSPHAPRAGASSSTYSHAYRFPYGPNTALFQQPPQQQQAQHSAHPDDQHAQRLPYFQRPEQR